MKYFENIFTNEQIFQYSIFAYATIALLLMLSPILFVKDHSGEHISSQELTYDKWHSGIFDNMREVWSDKNFRIFAIVELIYWFPSKIFTTAVPYYVASLMRLDNVYTSIILYISGIGSFLLYPLIDKLVEKYGKRKVLLSAFIFLAIASIYTALMGLFKMPVNLMIGLYILFNIYPVAVLGILPMALTGDNAEHNAKETGVSKNASYFALKTFMMKIGVALTSLIFPSLLLLGKTPDNPFGVRMVSISCMIACVLAYIVMRKYKDV